MKLTFKISGIVMVFCAVCYFLTSFFDPDFGVTWATPVKIAAAIIYAVVTVYFFTYPIGENK